MPEITETKAYKSALLDPADKVITMNASLASLELSRDANPNLTLAEITFIDNAIKYKRIAIANHINRFNEQWS